MEQLKTPASWDTMPNWFTNNQWLVQNQNHRFVMSLTKLITKIHVEMEIKHKPFRKTNKNYYIAGLKIQYTKALKNSESFVGEDYERGKQVIAKVIANFGNHMPFLKKVA